LDKDWVEPHGLKSIAPLHASDGGTLRSLPHYATCKFQGIPILAFTRGLKARGYLRRRVKNSRIRKALYILSIWVGFGRWELEDI
jgi:hypothetical protein